MNRIKSFPQKEILLKIEQALFFLLLFFLPTQLGKHFWPDFSVVSGIRVDYLSPTLYFTDVIMGLLFFVWIKNNYKSVISPFKKVKLFIGIVAFLSLTVILSQHILNGSYHLLKFLEFSFVAYYVATTVSDLKKLQKVVVVLAFAAIFQSSLAIAQFINQGSIGSVFYFFGERMFSSSTPGIANASINGQLLLRPYGTLPHPNVLAGFLLSVLLLCFWIFGEIKEQWKKILFSLSLLLGTGALILTMSRVAILIWIMFLLGFFMKARMGRRNKYFLVVGFFFLLSSLLFTPVGSRIIGTRLTEESVTQRQELIGSSLVLFKQHPLIGVGFGNFLPDLVGVQKPLSAGVYLQPVHNVFLLVLVETGIVGFLIFVWFIAKTYRYLWANKKSHGIFILLITATLLLGLFDHYLLTLQQGQLLLAFVIGLCWTDLDNRA